MKLCILVLLASLLALASTLADLEIVQTVKQNGSTKVDTETITRTKGDKMRVDVGKDVSSIIDPSKDQIISLLHSQKVAMVMPMKGIMEMAQQMNAAQGIDPNQKPEVKATGRKEKIQGYDTEEYEIIYGNMKMQAWVTHDLKDALEQMKALSSNQLPGVSQSSVDYDVLPGFPVRIVMDMGPGGEMTVETKSIKTDPLEDSIFQIPSGYKQSSMPLPSPQ